MKKLLTLILLSSCTSTQITKTRYCVVVNDVKYNKKSAAIQPKNSNYWYRYPTLNVHKGDTVDISINDRIEPKF